MFGHWFLIANKDSAKILTWKKDEENFEMLKKLTNPLAGLRRRDMVRKVAGRGVRSSGSYGTFRFSETKRSDPEEMALVQFTRDIADALEREKLKKNFESLTIVAEPHFLGRLKESMNPKVRKTVVNWIHKDLHKASIQTLKKLIREGTLGKQS